jgi:hypothetical protein
MNLWKHKLSGTYFLYPLKEQNGSSYDLPVWNRNFMNLVSDKDLYSRRLTNTEYKLVIPEEYM